MPIFRQFSAEFSDIIRERDVAISEKKVYNNKNITAQSATDAARAAVCRVRAVRIHYRGRSV